MRPYRVPWRQPKPRVESSLSVSRCPSNRSTVAPVDLPPVTTRVCHTHTHTHEALKAVAGSAYSPDTNMGGKVTCQLVLPQAGLTALQPPSAAAPCHHDLEAVWHRRGTGKRADSSRSTHQERRGLPPYLPAPSLKPCCLLDFEHHVIRPWQQTSLSAADTCSACGRDRALPKQAFAPDSCLLACAALVAPARRLKSGSPQLANILSVGVEQTQFGA